MNDVEISFSDLCKLIENEILWCDNNRKGNSKDYADGFIHGLRQAITLIENTEHAIERG